jgi:metal-responsive CopG/Arc/MetJ family transcriptional regulator
MLKYMRNVQITLDEKLIRAVDKAAQPLRLKRSHVVRLALQDWLRRQALEQFEREWIEMLGKHPDEPNRAEEWSNAQIWSAR